MAFLANVEAETGVPPLGESKYVDLGGPLLGRGVVAERDAICGYAHVLRHAASDLAEMELVAGVEATDGDLTALVEAVLDLADDHVLWWTFGETPAAAYAGARLAVHRQLHKLTGPLPLAEPRPELTDVRVAPFRLDQDEDEWLRVNNAAFADHPENGNWSRADLDERIGREWFDPDGFRLAWVEDRLAGFCWTKRHGAGIGEIHVIGVHPEFQGMGLGKQIVVEGLWYLADRGCSTAMLYVDTANASALGLYQSLGFSLERVDRCFVVPKDWPHEPQ